MRFQELPVKSCHDLREADPAIPLIDVRTEEEFLAGHPEGAVNLPAFLEGPDGLVPNPDFLRAVEAVVPDKQRRVLLSCAVGGRSRRACEQLAAAGYAHPINVLGGYSGARGPDGTVVEPGWRDAGLPTSSEPGGREWSSQKARLEG